VVATDPRTYLWGVTKEDSMSVERINLQNLPAVPGVVVRDVRFDSGDETLAGTLYTPEGDGPFPGVVVTGAWTTVKEQMPGTYARELAARGFAALAFDFTGWGGATGDRRYIEDPAVKTADIHAAAAFLAGHALVDGEALSGLGVCASAGYMASAVADDPSLRRLALVAPWLHDPAMAEQIYGGPESVAGLVAASDAADGADTPTVLVAASTTDEGSVMFQAPYYTEADRGLIDAYDNRFDVRSWRPWLTYDGHASADRLTAPTLVVCSDAAALPAGARAYAARTAAPLKELWLDDVSQFDFYDRADVVREVSDAVARHLRS
jgi:dienelactone hydrolase